MFWNWFFAIVFVSFGVIIFLRATSKDDDAVVGSLFGCVLFALGFIMILSLCEVVNNPPGAIDVYRGKTTLKITWRDSIPVDTVVIWK